MSIHRELPRRLSESFSTTGRVGLQGDHEKSQHIINSSPSVQLSYCPRTGECLYSWDAKLLQVHVFDIGMCINEWKHLDQTAAYGLRLQGRRYIIALVIGA